MSAMFCIFYTFRSSAKSYKAFRERERMKQKRVNSCVSHIVDEDTIVQISSTIIDKLCQTEDYKVDEL